MNVKKKLLAFIRMIGFLILTGCAPWPMRADTEYYIGFMNKTGRDLGPGMWLYYGNVEVGGPGGLVKGGMATEGVITLPVPAEAEMRWIDNGQRRSVKVKLAGIVPKRLTDEWTIYFVFNQDGTVQAKAVKDTDEAAKAELYKGLRPEGEYRMGIVNKTGHDLEGVSVNAGGAKVGNLDDPKGNIPARVKVAFSDPLLPPIPSEVELQWKEGGTPHSVKVKLADAPKGFEGIIYFVIKRDNTVEAHPVKKGDDMEAAKVVK